jgi:hypothetical protein
MQIIQSVAPDLNVCLTDSNQLVIMVDDEEGEHLAEVTDIDRLIQALRHVHLVQAERAATGESRRMGASITTAEVELNRRQAADPCPYTQAHTREFCGRPACRES